MAARLKSRDKPIPSGLRYVQHQTGKVWSQYWQFNQLVSDVVQYRVANQRMLARYKLSTDPVTVGNEVDEFNAAVCVAAGWSDYIAQAGPAPPPKTPPSQQSSQSNLLAAAGAKAKSLAAGYQAIRSWSKDGYPPVAPELSEHRAEVCALCPFNITADLTSFVTIPFAEAIRRDAQELHQRGLSTRLDTQLKICGACSCPLRLKVQLPLEPYIAQTLTEELLAKLKQAPACWIVTEAGK